MLQQTQVDTVIPYFERFLKKFPTVVDLARADLETVLKLWEGLGYYSRARNLHRAAKQLVTEFNATLPSQVDRLRQLPGFGPYTAAAVASIAFGEAVPVVDGNVLRVFSRFWGIADDIRQPATRNGVSERLTPFVKMADPSDFNQAMMELGALLCRPRDPACGVCPLQPDCVAYRTDRVTLLPVKSKLAPTPHYDIAVGVVRKGKTVLVGKRRLDQMLGGLWEFPGGKRKPNESLPAAVRREIKEETSLTVVIDKKLCTVKHAYTHFKITLHAYLCHVLHGKPIARSTTELRWVEPGELSHLPFPKANQRVIDALMAVVTSSRHRGNTHPVLPKPSSQLVK